MTHIDKILETADDTNNRFVIDKPEPIYIDKSGKKRYFTDAISGTNKGGHKRSKSFPGIASAMVDQWGGVVLNCR